MQKDQIDIRAPFVVFEEGKYYLLFCIPLKCFHPELFCGEMVLLS